MQKKLRRWTDEEEQMILNYPFNDKLVADTLGRTVHAVKIKRYRLLKEQKEKETQRKLYKFIDAAIFFLILLITVFCVIAAAIMKHV